METSFEWENITEVIDNFYQEGNYKTSLFIGCGAFLGLEVQDILDLTWAQLLSKKPNIKLISTGESLQLNLSNYFLNHVMKCHESMKIKDDSQKCFR